MKQSQLQPILFGGLFIGVLSGLPIIEIGNTCCCLWIVGGGMLTASLHRAKPLSLGEGALSGFLAGVAGAFVYVAVSIPINIVMAPVRRGMMEWMVNSGAVPPEFREMYDYFGAVGAEGIILGAVSGFVMMLFAGMIFSTLGGLLGALLLFRASPPPPSPPAPPSPPPVSSAPPSAPPSMPPPPAPDA